MAGNTARENALVIEAIALADQKKQKAVQKKQKAVQDGENQLALLLLPSPPGAKNTLQSRQATRNEIKSTQAKIRSNKTTAMAGGKKPSPMQRVEQRLEASLLEASISRIPTGADVSAQKEQQRLARRLARHENATRENDERVNEVVLPWLEKASPVWKSDMKGNLGTKQWALFNKTGEDIILMLSDSHTMRSRPRSYQVSKIKCTHNSLTSFSIQVIFSRLPEEKETLWTWMKRQSPCPYRERNNFILTVPFTRN
jgi:hypothetical protein